MVCQLKLLGNLRNFALVPISLVAAMIDLVYESEREGALFTRRCDRAAHIEQVINVYSAIEHHPPDGFKVNPAYTIDAVIAPWKACWCASTKRVERLSSKAAMDRAIDRVHRETKQKGDRARDVAGARGS